jgi:hypothetical protein
MKISQLFELEKSQAELDFIDIDTKRDTPLFLDPFFLSKRSDPWSMRATRALQSFFQTLIDLIKAEKKSEARKLFEHLHEPNATCLGLSSADPEGKGVGSGDSEKIFINLINSKAIQSGLLQDIEDNILFVENFGKDKLSDMTTNIIKKHLIEYTQNQCQLHGVPLTANIVSGYFWNTESQQWDTEYTDMLVVEDRPILLIPKGIVSFSKEYTPGRYYRHFILNFLQKQALDIKSALIRHYRDGTPYVNKKDLEAAHPMTKEFLRNFTLKYPEVLTNFKDGTKIVSIRNQDIVDINIEQISENLGSQLISIPFGNQHASAFHNKIIGVLELIFYPHLINPKKEGEIHNGRKRIDIVFDNAAMWGIFQRLNANTITRCPYIFVECKNYSSDPSNPELDQLAGRFGYARGQVGILVCRKFDNKPLFVDRCRDTYKDGRGLIIPLEDQDIINLLDNHNERDDTFFETYFSDSIRQIIVS